ncbi:hypothetical protein ACHAXH_003730 [Discostella pseudostelligera]
MISSLFIRQLPRPMAMQCARSAAIIGGSSQSSQFSLRAASLFFSSDAAAPTIGNGKDNNNHHTTKESLAMMLRDELKLSAKDSKRVIDAVFDKIVESLAKKETVSIYGFGKFSSVDVPARQYNNPSNLDGPKVSKEATQRVKFSAFKHLKECVVAGKVVAATSTTTTGN